jgi:hypothetical protein
MRPLLTLFQFERLILAMKSSVLLLTLATTATSFAEVAIVPERLTMDRYQKLKDEAPFAVKTDVAAPVEQKIDWAENYYLSGASKVTENGTEKDLVFINHKSDPTAGFQLYGTEPGKDGIQIVKLEWDPENPIKTAVTLKKGTEFAVLKRDLASFAAAPLPQQPGPGGNRPVPPQGVPVPNATGAIRQPVLPPRTQPQIPRPGNVVPAPQAAYPQAAAGNQQGQPSDPRRRIRVINR